MPALTATVTQVEPTVLVLELFSTRAHTRDRKRGVYNLICTRYVVGEAYELVKLVTFTHSYLAVSAHKPALLLVRLVFTEGRRRVLGRLNYRPPNAERLVDELAQARSRPTTREAFPVLYSRPPSRNISGGSGGEPMPVTGTVKEQAVCREARARQGQQLDRIATERDERERP